MGSNLLIQISNVDYAFKIGKCIHTSKCESTFCSKVRMSPMNLEMVEIANSLGQNLHLWSTQGVLCVSGVTLRSKFC